MSSDERDAIARSLAHAGARPGAPADIAAGVRAAVEMAWRENLERREIQRRRKWQVRAAAALVAGVGLILALSWQWQQHPVRPAGLFLASRGSVDIRSALDAEPAVGGSTLVDGTRVQTGPDGMALLAIGEVSVRIGPSSLVRLDRADRLSMERGRIYFDFGAPTTGTRELRLTTPFGTIDHLGTQYQADLQAHRLTVSVREGQVRLSTSEGDQLLGARESADVDEHGRAHLQAVEPFGDAWAWTSRLVPDFPIEGQSLAQFLTWFSRQTGQKIDYAAPEVLAAAQHTRLSGSIVGLSPQDALKAVIAATQFDYQMLANGDLRLTMHVAAHAKLLPDGTDRPETR